MDRLTALLLARWTMDLRTLTWRKERLLGLLLAIPGFLVFSAFASLGLFVGVRAVQAFEPAAVGPALSALATLVGFTWCASPLLSAGAVSDNHDVSRLAQFPIPLRTLVAAALLGNLVHPAVLAEVPVVLALSAALAPSVLVFPLVLAGVLLSLAFFLAAGQVSALALHALARNRRFHDVALFLGLGIGFGVSLLPILVLSPWGGVLRQTAASLVLADVFAVSPFGWGVRAAVAAGRGQALAASGWAAAAAAAIAGAMGLAGALIARIHTGELDLAGAQAHGRGPGRMWGRGPLGALLEKDLRAAWRDPALKATLLFGLLGPLVFFLFLVSQTGTPRSGNGLLAFGLFVGFSGFGANVFGMERRGVALLMAFPVERWRILVAKNLSTMAFRLPGLLLLVTGGLVLAGPMALPAAAVAAIGLLVSSGMDNYASILFPVTVPAPGANPYAGGVASGRGIGAVAFTAALLGLAALVASPFLFLVWLPLLLENRLLWLGSIPLALAGAAAVYAMLVAGAARLLERREPELLERVLGEA